MKKKLWSAALTVIMVIAFVLGLSACGGIESLFEEPKSLRLNTPNVTLSESGVASWEEVKNASGYAYQIDDGDLFSTRGTTAQLRCGETIVVKAVGDGYNFEDSLFSDPVTYRVELETPVVAISASGSASWEAVDHASAYLYKINDGEETRIEGTSVQLSDGDSIIVKAVGDGKGYIDSGWSEEETYTAQTVPQPQPLATPAVSVDETGMARWEAVENAEGYLYKINDGEETRTEGTSVQLSDGDSIIVKAVGDGENFIDSGWSQAVSYNVTPPQPTKLETPEIDVDENGLATWGGVNGADGYKYKINSEADEHIFEGERLEYQLHDGEYIEVKAFSNNADLYTESDWGRSETYRESHVTQPTQLATPEVTLEGNVASWEQDPNAVRYEYIITEAGQDGAPVTAQDTHVELENGQSVKVRAIGDGENYTDSEWSVPVTYTAPVPEPTQLLKPVVSVDEDGLATWVAVDNAEGYLYKINDGEETPTADTSVQLASGETIVVKAVGDGENYIDSDWSDPKTYTKQSEEGKEGLLATFELGKDVEKGVEDNTNKADGTPTKEYTEDDGDYKLVLNAGVATDADSKMSMDAWDNKGNGVLKIGSSKNVGVFTLVVPEGVTKVVFYIAGYKDKNVAVSIQSGKSEAVVTLIKDFHSQEGKYQAVEVTITGTTEADRTIKFTTLEKGTYEGTSIEPRCKIDAIEFYGSTAPKLEKLEMPVVEIDKDGNATWKADPNASYYLYKINGGEEKQTSDASVQLSDGDSIVVKAVGDGETYESSDWSAEATYTAPVTLGKLTVSISDNGLASWEADENAKEYEYIITKDGQEESPATTSDTSVQLQDGWSIRVRAIGDGEHYLSGDWSDEATYRAPEKITLDAPTVEIDENGKATWTEVPNATGYKYQIDGVEGQPLDAHTCEVQLQPGQSIQVMALGNGEKYQDSAWSEVKLYTATLEAPVVSIDEQTGKATWTEVEHASSYLYKIGSGSEVKVEKGAALEVTLQDGESISVKAVGDGKAYNDSAWSDPATYHAPTDYGTKENPLSVSEALKLAEKECVENGDYTAEVVTMTGKVKNTPQYIDKNGGYYQELTLVGEDGAEILVWTINLEEGSDVAAPVQNDILTIQGYIKKHTNGVIEFASKEVTSNNYVNVYAIENVRGESTITVENGDGAQVSDIAAKALNGSTVSFTVTADEGKDITVTVYGETLVAAEGGAYSFEVKGNATVKITLKDHSDTPEPEDGLVASLTFNQTIGKDDLTADKKKVSGYTSTWYATRNGIEWTISNFNNNSVYGSTTAATNDDWTYIKTGRKDYTVVGTITTSDPFAEAINRIVVTIHDDSKTLDGVKSFTLQISSTANFEEYTEVLPTITDGSGNKIQKGENVFNIEKPQANQYYRIVIDCDKKSNGFVVLSAVNYYEAKSTPVTPLTAPELHVDNHTGEVTWDEVDGATGYTYTVGDGQPKTLGKDDELKVTLQDGQSISVIANGDGTTYSDSPAATAEYHHVHDYTNQQYGADDDYHWLICDYCHEPNKAEQSAHSYKDGTCSVCQHAHAEHVHDHYEKDENGHKSVCACGAEIDKEAQQHSYEWKQTEDGKHYQHCTVCDYDTAQATHTYEWHYEEGTSHYKACECGEIDQATRHDVTLSYVDEENGQYHHQKCTGYGGACEYVTSSELHTYEGGKYVSDEERGHHQLCTACGHAGETTAHNFGETYESTATEHWQKCPDCQYESAKSAHTYTKTPGVCDVCGKEHTEHSYDETYVNDGVNGHHRECTVCRKPTDTVSHELSYVFDGKDQHHQECAKCDYKTESTAHTYDKDKADGLCTKCEHAHEDHTYDEWGYDESEHWHICSVCGVSRGDNSVHNYTEGDSQDTCKDCKYNRTHVHEYTAWAWDGENHWKYCPHHGDNKTFIEAESKVAHEYDKEKGDGVCTEPNCQYNHSESSNHKYEKDGKDDSTHWKECAICGMKDGVTAHSYEWKLVEGQHAHVCTCGHEDVVRHAPTQGDWDHSADKHWHKCGVEGCTLPYDDETEHTTFTWVDNKGTNRHEYTCSDCGYVKEYHGNTSFSTSWKNDGANHWHECEAESAVPCTVKSEFGAHSYDETWKHNDEKHYHVCTTCAYEDVENGVAHTFKWVATEDGTTHNYQCTEAGCGYVKYHHEANMSWHTDDETEHWKVCAGEAEQEPCDITTDKSSHAHDHYAEIEGNNEQHNDVCECGRVIGTADHTYDTEAGTGLCTKCEHEHTDHDYDKGLKDGKCTTCGKLHDHADSAFTWVDNKGTGQHELTCGTCGLVKDSHAADMSAYNSNSDQHWAKCAVEGCTVESTEKADHTFTWKYGDEWHYENCVCGYTKEETKHASNSQLKWIVEETQHHQECEYEGCGYTSAPSEHTYDKDTHKCECDKVDPDVQKVETAINLIKAKFNALEKDTSRTYGANETVPVLFKELDLTDIADVTIEVTDDPEGAVTYGSQKITIKNEYWRGVCVTIAVKVTLGDVTQSTSKLVKLNNDHLPDDATEKEFQISGLKGNTLSLNIDGLGNVIATFESKGNTGNTNSSGTEWRMYQTAAHKSVLTFMSNTGATIQTVKLTYNTSNSGILIGYTPEQTEKNATQYPSGTVIIIRDGMKFGVGNTGSATNGQVQIKSITVVYSGGKSQADIDKQTAQGILDGFNLETFENKTVEGLDKIGTEVTLPTSTEHGAKVEWSIVNNDDVSNFVGLAGNVLTVKALPSTSMGDQTVDLKVTVNVGGQEVEGSLQVTLRAYDYENYLKGIIGTNVTGMPKEVIYDESGSEFEFTVEAKDNVKFSFASEQAVIFVPDETTDGGKIAAAIDVAAGTTVKFTVTATYGGITWATATQDYEILVRYPNEEEITALLEEAYGKLEGMPASQMLQGASTTIKLPDDEKYSDILLGVEVAEEATAGKVDVSDNSLEYTVTASTVGEAKIVITLTYMGDVHNYDDEVSYSQTVTIEVLSASQADDVKITEALGNISESVTVDQAGTKDLNPTQTVEGVTLKWAYAEGNDESETYPLTEAGVLTVNRLPDVAATLHLTVTASCGNGTPQTKDVTVTISAINVTDLLKNAVDALEELLNKQLDQGGLPEGELEVTEDGYEVDLSSITDVDIELTITVDETDYTNEYVSDDEYIMITFTAKKLEILIFDYAENPVSIKLTFKPSYHGTSNDDHVLTRTYTIPAKVVEPAEKTITLTAAGFGITTTSTYKTGTKEISGITFAYEIAKDSNGAIQLRQPTTEKDAYIYNQTNLGTRIISIKAVGVTTGSKNGTTLAVAFGASQNPAGEKAEIVTNAVTQTSSDCEFTVPNGKNYSYFKLYVSGSSASYITSIVITYSTKEPSDDEKLAAAKEALQIEETELTQNLTLPTLDGFDITWKVTKGDSNARVSADGATLEVTQPEAGENNVEITLHAVIKIEGKTDKFVETDFTLTIKAKTAQGGGEVEEKTITLSLSTLSFGGSGYSKWGTGKTVGGIQFNGKDSGEQSSNWQFKTSSGSVYNVDSLGIRIAKIEIVFVSSSGTIKLGLGTSSMATVTLGDNNSNSITMNGTVTAYENKGEDNYTFFKLSGASTTAKITSIKITYFAET